MITAVRATPPIAWGDLWQHAEVVDGVLVEEPVRPGSSSPGAGVYDRSGRVPEADRYGRLVCVVA